MSTARGCASHSVSHTSSDIGRFVHLLLEAAKMLMQGNLSGYNHVCLEINAAQWKATAWEWMRGRKRKESSKEETGKEESFFQEKLEYWAGTWAALSWKKVPVTNGSVAEYVPQRQRVGVTCPQSVWWLCLTSRSILAPELTQPWHLFCLMCRAQQQHVLTEVMVQAPYFTLLSGGLLQRLVCIASGQGAAAETDPLRAEFPRGAYYWDQGARVGPWETSYFACS